MSAQRPVESITEENKFAKYTFDDGMLENSRALIFTSHAGKLQDIRGCLWNTGEQRTTDYHPAHCVWPDYSTAQLTIYNCINAVCDRLRVDINMLSVTISIYM